MVILQRVGPLMNGVDSRLDLLTGEWLKRERREVWEKVWKIDMWIDTLFINTKSESFRWHFSSSILFSHIPTVSVPSNWHTTSSSVNLTSECMYRFPRGPLSLFLPFLPFLIQFLFLSSETHQRITSRGSFISSSLIVIFRTIILCYYSLSSSSFFSLSLRPLFLSPSLQENVCRNILLIPSQFILTEIRSWFYCLSLYCWTSAE